MGVDIKLTGIPNFDKLEVVKSGITTIQSDGSPTNWSTTPHNLGYTPTVLAYLNDVSIAGVSSTGNIPLPTYLGLTVDTVNDVVILRSWIHADVDDTNLYIILYNSQGGVISPYEIKYYLLRDRSD